MAVNISKNSGTPTQIGKVALGGYGYGRYGMTTYGQGGPVNISKTSNGVYLWSITTLPWQESAPWQIDGSATAPTNVSKNTVS